MKKNLALAAGALLALSSCTTVQHTASTEQIETRIVNMTVANVDVSKEKAQHTFNWQWTPFNTFSLNAVKQSAAAELLMEKKADVLVEPQYIVNRQGLFRGGSITVIGYPAKYTDFRPMTEQDAKLLSESSPQVTRPVIPTGFASPFQKIKKIKNRPLADNTKRHFVSVVAGPLFELYDGNVGGVYGLMYGQYNPSAWGWYTKLQLASINEYDGYDDETNMGAFVTAGAVKPLSSKFNLMFGAGIGSGFDGYESYGDVSYNQELAIPLEVMGQFNFNHFNISAGLNYQIMCTGENKDGNLSLQFGIGYTF